MKERHSKTTTGLSGLENPYAEHRENGVLSGEVESQFELEGISSRERTVANLRLLVGEQGVPGPSRAVSPFFFPLPSP